MLQDTLEYNTLWLLSRLQNSHMPLMFAQMLGVAPSHDVLLPLVEKGLAREAKGGFSPTPKGTALLLKARANGESNDSHLDKLIELFDSEDDEAVCLLCLEAIYRHDRLAENLACYGYLDLLLGRVEKWLVGSRVPDLQRITPVIVATVDVSLYFLKFVPKARYLLESTLTIAKASENRRIEIFLNVCKGFMFFFSGIVNYKLAYAICEKAMLAINSFNEVELYNQCRSLFFIIHFLAGDYKTAIDIFEKMQSNPQKPFMPLMESQMVTQAASAATYRGFFPYAEGMLKSAVTTSEIEGNRTRSLICRYHLGILLAYMRRNDEALALFQSILSDPAFFSIPKFSIRTYIGIALCQAYRGELALSYRTISNAFEEVHKDTSLTFGNCYPWMLELAMLYALEGYPVLKDLDFDELYESMREGPNHMMRGNAFRMKATFCFMNGRPLDEVMQYVEDSIRIFESVGAPLEKGLALDLKARVLEKMGQARGAALARNEARQVLAAIELERLVSSSSADAGGKLPSEDGGGSLFKKFCFELGNIREWDTLENYCNSLAIVMRKIFHAERVAIFHSKGSRLECIGCCNLSQTELNEDNFKPVTHRLPENIRRGIFGYSRYNGYCILTIPFNANDEESWVIYIDSAEKTSRLHVCSSDDLQHMSLFCTAELRNAVRLLSERRNLREKQRIQVVNNLNHEDMSRIVGKSPSFKRCLEQAHRVAGTDAAILLLGETGVGKEVLANYIHQHSNCSGPFVAVHPAALSESLFENEFFGHEKGAFTGASERKIGYCELADKGTLFIDEVGDIPLNMQIKLLRVLQEHKFNRVGGTTEVYSSFRIVAATNRDLKQAIADQMFREDLYYRLAVFPIRIPALRERREDLEELFLYFLDLYSRRYGKKMPYPGEELLEIIQNYAWPGNIREMKNIVERAVILSDENTFDLHFLPADVRTTKELGAELDTAFAELPTLDEVQRRYIEYVMQRTGGKISGLGGASDILGMKRSTLYVKLREYGIESARKHREKR